MGHYEWDCPRHHFIVTSPHNIRGWGNTTAPAPQQHATADPAPDQADSANILEDVIQTNSRIPASHMYFLLFQRKYFITLND